MQLSTTSLFSASTRPNLFGTYFYALVTASILSLCACSKTELGGAQASKEVAETKATGGRYLAYQHQVGLELEAERISTVSARLEKLCAAAVNEHCELLESQLSTGRGSSANLKFRASRSGIKAILMEIEKLGKVIDQSTTAEDLAAPIGDTKKKQELLTDYRQRLEALRDRAKNDVDALIKVNKELAQVQNDLEALSGKYAQLQQRVDTEILYVRLSSIEQSSFSAPLKAAVHDFSSNLAQGSASAITGFAYLLPWSILLSLCFIVIRKVWRWRRAGKTPALPSDK